MLKWDYKSKVLLDVLGLFKSRVFLRLIRKNEFVICVIDILLMYDKCYIGVIILVNMLLNFYYRYSLLERV